jgi:hypothetical protein
MIVKITSCDNSRQAADAPDETGYVGAGLPGRGTPGAIIFMLHKINFYHSP